ncbi:MAG: hypothetical protein D4S01_11560 [Dehalococcoidia bacterium]|nr:MAG: hypothetical protein D4S01_11560 [Dehalococcoidia bacterium]
MHERENTKNSNWKTTDYRLDPHPDHKIIIAVKPTVKFWEKRNVDCPYEVIYQDDIIHHHLSWCEPKDIHQKVTNYCHANEFNGKKWYWEHFMKWKVGDKAVEPFGTVFDAVREPLPKELKDLL